MLAVNYTGLRERLKAYMDRVSDEYETLVVTRKNNKNIVMISEETYNNMLENIYVLSDEANYKWLMESKRQLMEGQMSSHDLVEAADE